MDLVSSMYFAFGLILKENDLPFRMLEGSVLESKKESEDTWVIVLKESVREVNARVSSIGIQTMNTSHFSYLEEFIHEFGKEIGKVPSIPEWILCTD